MRCQIGNPGLSQRYKMVEEVSSGKRVSVQRPTDELVQKIRSWLEPGVRTKWSDRPRERLEDELNDVLKGFLIACGVLQRWRIRRQ